jgi:hypothetical protein
MLIAEQFIQLSDEEFVPVQLYSLDQTDVSPHLLAVMLLSLVEFISFFSYLSLSYPDLPGPFAVSFCESGLDEDYKEVEQDLEEYF